MVSRYAMSAALRVKLFQANLKIKRKFELNLLNSIQCLSPLFLSFFKDKYVFSFLIFYEQQIVFFLLFKSYFIPRFYMLKFVLQSGCGIKKTGGEANLDFL